MAFSRRILLTRRFPEAVIERAKRDYDATVNMTERDWQGDDLIARSAGFDGLLISPTNAMTAAVIEGLPDSVRIMATFSVGYEHVDLEAAGRRGIIVTNTPGVLDAATADMAMLLLLAASRRAREGLSMVTAGDWKGWTPTQLLGREAGGHRLGILGMGRIGRAVAERARAFGLEIHYHNRNRLAPDLEHGATYHANPESLFRVSDFLSLHCALTPETTKILDAEHIALLPAGAVVVNTARGGVIDDDALIEALRSGRVAAAGLDVFAGEPDVDPRYLDLPNAFLTPHLGSSTVETRNAMGFRALDNLDAFFRGEEPPDRIA